MIDRANVLLLTLFAASGRLRDRLRREEGQAFVEYAMVLLLVTIVISAFFFVAPLRGAIEAAVDRISDAITDAGT